MKTSQESRAAIGYCRVSTEEQATDGGSLDMQEAKIRAYCEQAEFTLLPPMFMDRGISGKEIDNRPQAQAAIAEAICQKGVLVVYSLSRLSRSLKDTFEIAEKLQQGGAEIVSIKEKFDTTSPTGRMIFGILAVLNQFEREITRERTIDTLKRKKQNGERVGRYAQYGYSMTDKGVVISNYEEKIIVTYIKQMHEQGQSPKTIATWLNCNRYRYRNEKLWKARYVERILNS